MNGAPTPAVITIEGIRAQGHHGANPGERSEAQEFAVDVEVWVEVASDDLRATIDYRVLVDRVRRTVEEGSFVLLETMAEAVATDLLELDPVLRATATVHKPRAASSMGVGDVSVEFTVETA